MDGNDLGKIAALSGKAQFVLPDNTPIGKHVLEIGAYDFARNKQDVVLPITVEPFMPPMVTVSIKNIVIGGMMTISGEKSGINQVMIFIPNMMNHITGEYKNTACNIGVNPRNVVNTCT